MPQIFSPRTKAAFTLLAVTLLATGCSSSAIIRDHEYKYTEASTRNSDYEAALKEFPKKEKKGFITSVEKSWLGFWNKNGEVDDLQRQKKTFDQRQFLSISREAQYFFYRESEDGYVPAEHEVIILHLLSSMLFMQHQKWEEARVDAAKASYYLQGFFTEQQAHFDDPALRLWMAGVWAALGEWNEAQVDLRRVTEISKQSEELKALLESTRPPTDLAIYFSGVGPDLKWSQGQPQPDFLENRNEPEFFFQDSKSKIVSKSTHSWFERHQSRNTAIRDTLLKSNYMMQFLGTKAEANAQRATGKILYGTLATGAILVGGGIVVGGIYLLLSTPGSEELFQYALSGGVLVGGLIWKEAADLDKTIQKRADEDELKSFENMRTYRFVRLMPNWISLGWGPMNLQNFQSTVDLQSPKSKTKVHFIHRP